MKLVHGTLHGVVPAARSGFTLLETLMVVAIVAMLAVMVIPSSHDDARLKAEAAVSILVSDIELAQVMSISSPKEPVMVVFDRNNRSYWLAHESAPSQPLINPHNNRPYHVTFGEGRASSATGVEFNLNNMPERTLQFTPHGAVRGTNQPPEVVLRVPGINHPVIIRVTLTTGRIEVEEGTGR